MQIGLKVLPYAMLALLIACILFVVWAKTVNRGPANRSNYNKIAVGMTEAEVEALLGGPGEELAPLTYEDVRSDEGREVLLRSAPHTLRHGSGIHT